MMPRIRSSTPTSLDNLTPIVQPQNAIPATQSATVPQVQRSPFMHAAMPLMASTADAFVRQFYSQENIPQQRILPAKGASGK